MTLIASPEAECRICTKPFIRRNTMHIACSPRCAMRSVAATKKAEKDDARARQLAIKSRAKWLAEAQAAFNAYVRRRDQGKPCISCTAPWSPTAQAGHYLSRGARPELRFDLANVASQCVVCNLHRHGNQAMYRIGLLQRIGREAVERLEGPTPQKHYSVDDLRIIKHVYREKARELETP